MKKIRSDWTIKKFSSFAEAEESDIEYYASIDWEKSAKIVEEMRKQFWGNDYPGKIEEIFRRAKLKDLTDDFE